MELRSFPLVLQGKEMVPTTGGSGWLSFHWKLGWSYEFRGKSRTSLARKGEKRKFRERVGQGRLHDSFLLSKRQL